MAKLRLDFQGNSIIMKKIITIVIDGVEYSKPAYDGGVGGRVLQQFYHFIQRNVNDVEFVSYTITSSDTHEYHMYLKNGLLHCMSGPAHCQMIDGKKMYGAYCIRGKRYGFEEWNKKSRGYKLKKLSII